MAGRKGQNPESVVREIRRKTRRKFSIEEKIRIVLDGLKGESSIADIDLKRQKWTRFLYDVDFNDPLHYDMILNRDKLTLDSMAAIISCTIKKPEYEIGPQTIKIIRDVHLKSIVLATFARSPRTRGMELAVQCDSDRGYVRVSGIAPILGMGTWT
jgi:hypothetical protein